MKPKPMIFTPWSVRSILDRNKTETRRLSNRFKIKPGDLVYGKEAYCIDGYKKKYRADYLGSPELKQYKWISPLLMPLLATRLILETIDVSEERLKDITEEGAIREGIQEVVPGTGKYPIFTSKKLEISEECFCDDSRLSFADLWNWIHKKPFTWGDNPQVFVFQFKIHEVLQ